MPMSAQMARASLETDRQSCRHCGSRLWTLCRRGKQQRSRCEIVRDALKQMPPSAPGRPIACWRALVRICSVRCSGQRIRVHQPSWTPKASWFSDRQAQRMERALSTMEFAFGQGDYQPSEFVKRYLPQGFFGLLVVDEGTSTEPGQRAGQAMGCWRASVQGPAPHRHAHGRLCRRHLFLLWRLNPGVMIEDGFRANARGSLGSAAMGFMREHGVLKDIYKGVGEHLASHREGPAVAVTAPARAGLVPRASCATCCRRRSF